MYNIQLVPQNRLSETYVVLFTKNTVLTVLNTFKKKEKKK